MAAGGNNQRLTSPSCNPLRLAKHAANDRSNFHYCKTFIYELCRCQSTQIFKTVKARKKNLWIARGSLPSSSSDHSSTIWYILPSLLCGTSISESVFLIMSEKTVFVKFIRWNFQNCVSAWLVQNCVSAWHQRSEKLFLPNSGAPCPPFPYVTLGVTFHPNTFTCRASVRNRGTWNLPPTTPSSCLPL